MMSSAQPTVSALRDPGIFWKYLALFTVTAIIVAPLLATALGGFKSQGELRTNPFGLPSVWHFEHYLDILFGIRYWRMMGNSLLISSVAVFITLSCSATAAFVFAHLKFFGRELILNYMTVVYS